MTDKERAPVGTGAREKMRHEDNGFSVCRHCTAPRAWWEPDGECPGLLRRALDDAREGEKGLKDTLRQIKKLCEGVDEGKIEADTALQAIGGTCWCALSPAAGAARVSGVSEEG
jgi:hypothetical protein